MDINLLYGCWCALFYADGGFGFSFLDLNIQINYQTRVHPFVYWRLRS
jgi:hypothetical protein